jgi:hypothetical protein
MGEMGILDRLLGTGANKPARSTSPFGVDAAVIYCLYSVQKPLFQKCEDALAENIFDHHGVLTDEDRNHMISFRRDGSNYVALVQVQHVPGMNSALIVNAVYDLAGHDTGKCLDDLRECCRSKSNS